MSYLHKLLLRIFSLLFGEFNGMQIFLYPMTLVFWIDTDSFLYATTGLLTTQKHYFPLTVFLLFFLFTLFLVVKYASIVFGDKHPHTQGEVSNFRQTVMTLHKMLLIAVVCAALIWVVSAFLKYYFGISVPLKSVYPFLIKTLSILIILWYALVQMWTKPFRDMGQEPGEAWLSFRGEYKSHPGIYSVHTISYALLAVIGCFIFNLLIVNVLYGVFGMLGISLNLYLAAPSSIGAILYNVFIFAVAMLLSNLLFSPIVKAISRIADRQHPHHYLFRQSPSHAQEETGPQE
jgi:hypothetical protein